MQSSCTGQLVVFFPTNVFVEPKARMDDERAAMPSADASSKPLRLSEAFGNLATPDADGAYQETDEALQMVSARSMRSVSGA